MFPFILSLTAQEVEERLNSISNKLDKDVIRQSLANPSSTTVPSTQAMADVLGPLSEGVEGLGSLAGKDSVALDTSEVTGVLPISKGGTGASSLEQAQQNLGILSEEDITTLIESVIPEIGDVQLDSAQTSGVLPISKGGSGAQTTQQARINLGVWSASQSETVRDSVNESLRRSYAEAGYNVVGTFREGFTIANANDVVIDERTGKAFSGPAGDVAAGTNPTSGGFVDVSDAVFASATDIQALLKKRPTAWQVVVISSFYPGWGATALGPVGGGVMTFDPTRSKAEHNGGTIISPTVPWNGAPSGLANFLNGVGETDSGGSGCWVSEAKDVTCFGAHPYNTGAQNDPAFTASLAETGSLILPRGMVFKTASGISIGSNKLVKFDAGAALQPDASNIGVLKFQGDFSEGHNLRVINAGGFTGCTGIAFSPISAGARVNQRYNRLFNTYVDGLHHAVTFQCGDFVIAEGFASGCWYNEIYGGEYRNIESHAIYFKKGLNTNPGVTTQDPATSNRNSLRGVSVHFCKGAGVKVESGETNVFYNYNYESCNYTGSVAVDIDYQAAGSPPNPNSHNRFIFGGSESCTRSMENNNPYSVFKDCTFERNVGDNWGGCVNENNDPSRQPYITPLIEREDYDSGRGRFTGRMYQKATRGIEYETNVGGEPGANFTVHDKNHHWQQINLPALITNAAVVSGTQFEARYQKSGNMIDLVIRAKVESITGNIEITLPNNIAFPSGTYYGTAVGVNSMTWPISVYTPSVGVGHVTSVTANKLRILNSSGWATGSQFHINIRFRVSDSV